MKSTAAPRSDDAAAAGDDGRRFLDDFATMSSYGATECGGVDRQAGTDADAQVRRWLEQVLRNHGFRVEYDAIGNQFGLVEPNPGAPFVFIGSHLDSQPTAGRFDGAYGVLTAAHAAIRLAGEWAAGGHVPQFNLAVVNWFNEEGSRFTPSMMGSAVFTGKLALETALAATDGDGVSVAAELRRHGLVGVATPTPAFCVEIHIEQGRLLEEAGSVIGLVEATWGARKYLITVNGEQSHSGATVMADRRDALAAAAALVTYAYETASDSGGRLHSSVGQLDVYPNSPVVVASRATLLMDFRSMDAALLDEIDNGMAEVVAGIERKYAVSIDSARSHSWDVNPYQPEGVELAESVADDLGLTRQRILTVAGHDSTNMKDIVPTVMLFVPSVQGISHNENETTDEPDMLDGLRVFTEVARRVADGALRR